MSILVAVLSVASGIGSVVFLAGLFASYRFPSDGTLRGRLRNTFAALGLFLFPSATSVTTLYNLWGHHVLTDNSLYINLGYWKTAQTLDEAGRDMAQLLGQSAGIEATDAVLDVGFGFADQDMYWMETFSPAKITGLNITASQVETAIKRVQARGMSDTIELFEGSATQMPFEAESFDKVMALECAFHFDTRERFFADAHRVLRDGGRLAIADVIPLNEPDWPKAHGIIARLLEPLKRASWIIPRANQYGRDEYKKRLEASGFSNVNIVSIRDHVYKPLRTSVKNIVRVPHVLARLHPLHRSRFAIAAYAAFVSHGPPFAPMDYVIVTADKRPAAVEHEELGLA